MHGPARGRRRRPWERRLSNIALLPSPVWPPGRRGRFLAVLLVLWATAWFLRMSPGAGSWHFFVLGGQSLADVDDTAGGLHVYAAHPFLQIGPVALLVAAPLAALPPVAGVLAAELLGVAAGAGVVWAVADAARRLGPANPFQRWYTTVAIAAFVPVWTYVAVGSAHLDDVLALLFAALAVRAVSRRSPVAVAVLVGLAVDAKPWALPFAALLLLFGGRELRRAVLALALVVAAAWLPFFLVDPSTVHALRYTIPNHAMSGLRVLGVEDARTPTWDRAAQLALGLALGAVAVRRGRWPAVLLLAIAVRLALDPGTNRYYAAGAAVGALVWDLLGARTGWPWWSMATTLVLFGTRYLPLPAAAHGVVMLAFCGACLVLPWLPVSRRAS